MPKLNTKQEQRIAKLLVHFSGSTCDQILDRFGKATRDRVRIRMRELIASNSTGNAESLNDFAEFLYFEPESSPTTNDQAPVRVANRREIVQPTGDLSFQSLIGMSDKNLDVLLRAAPPGLTISVLCCSPEPFIRRVMQRLSEDEATAVHERIHSTGTVDIHQMQKTHQQYCRFASQLVQDGLIDLRNDQQHSNTRN